MNILNSTFEGKKIVAVYDISTGGGYTPTVLLSVAFEDQTFGVLILDVRSRKLSELKVHQGAGTANQMRLLFENMTRAPTFGLDIDCGYYEVLIHITEERHLIAREERQPDSNEYVWQVAGLGASGSVACREFQKHGFTFSVT